MASLEKMAWRISYVAAALGCATTASSPPLTGDATGVIAEALRTHSLVLISEHHWSVPVHEQLRRIIADPKVGGLVQDILVEFGNPLYQTHRPLRRWGSGPDRLGASRLAQYDQLLAWDSPLYQQFYETVRAINAAAPDRRCVSSR